MVGASEELFGVGDAEFAEHFPGGAVEVLAEFLF